MLVLDLYLILFWFLFVNNILKILFNNYLIICVLYSIKAKLINRNVLIFFVLILFLSLFIFTSILLLFLSNI